jgi:two-component system chemotaxis response regulator CheB
VAPPDRHLIVESGHVHLSVGPKENRTRPAINPLFRSAALAYGRRVIGIVLSGILEDGMVGLWEIKRRGGVAIVQLPEDTSHKDMPKSAIANVNVDYQIPVAEMEDLLVSLVGGDSKSADTEVEAVMPEKTRLTGPDCHGPMERLQLGSLTE